MRILLLDDQPAYMNARWLPDLRDAGHEVHFVKRMHKAIERLQEGQAFDLVVLDLLMDHEVPAALDAEQKLVSEALRAAGHLGETTTQALGLWLWKQARPYCYLTSYPRLWRPGVGSPPEYNGASTAQLKRLVCDRGSEGDPETYVQEVRSLWVSHFHMGGRP